VALNDQKSVNRTVNTAFLILGAGGFLALVITVAAVTFFLPSFKVDPQLRSSGQLALLITGLNTSLILPFSVFSAVLIALERFDVLSGVTIIGEVTRAVLVVTFLRSGYGLAALALIALAITVMQYSVFAVFVKRLYPPMKLHWIFIDKATLRSLFGFGIYRFIWIIANQLIFYSDSVVIGMYLGTGAITHFAIAGSLINYGRNVVSLVTDTLYPAATRMDARQDLKALQKLLFVGTKIALLVALPLCVGLIFLGRQFITLWMGPAYASSALFLVVLTIPQFGGMSQYASVLILAGMAKHKALAYFVLVEGVANLILSIILVQRIGLIGVAWGTVVPDLICTTLVVPVYTLRILKVDPRQYLVKAYLRPVACALPVSAIAYSFSVLVQRPSWLLFAAEVGVICGVFAVFACFLCFDHKQRGMVTAKVSMLFHREGVVHEA
jgi:O-antigen/teichoic acid export membrane protein